MFTPSTWYFLSREIVDIWKQLEEKTNEQQTHQLTKYANSPSNWYKKQLEGIPNFQKAIEKLGDEELERINKASEKAIKKAIDLVDNETLKSFRVKETKQEIRQDKERFIASSVKKVINQNEGKMNAFIRGASVRNGEFINKINVKKESTAKIRTQFTVNTKTQELYDIIRKQTEEGIQKGVPFTYSNGRRVPFKAHMEMSIRTTIQNEALERMTTAASNLGIIFYLASEHADSADDHANFQGKIYVLENWESKITDSETREKVRNFIREKDIRTIEWVKGEPVYFNTRPNCRHYFIPITIEQAMGNLNNLKRNLRTKKGSYKEENYQDLKLQRHNERQIRFYKERAKNNEILLARTKDPFMQSQLRNQITRDNRLVRDWQARQRGLLKSNPNLERNYRRESTEKMAQDLGVKLHLKGGKSLPNVPKNDIIDTVKEMPKGLVNVETGEVTETKIGRLDPNSLKNYNKKTGWNVNWSELGPDVQVYGIIAKGDRRLQGLVGLEKQNDMQSMYVSWISTAPHNNKQITGGKQDYKGVGSYLIAKAAEESVKAGFGGHMYGFANTKKTLEHYKKAWGAKRIGMLHQYHFEIDEKASRELIEKYSLEVENKDDG